MVLIVVVAIAIALGVAAVVVVVWPSSFELFDFFSIFDSRYYWHSLVLFAAVVVVVVDLLIFCANLTFW